VAEGRERRLAPGGRVSPPGRLSPPARLSPPGRLSPLARLSPVGRLTPLARLLLAICVAACTSTPLPPSPTNQASTPSVRPSSRAPSPPPKAPVTPAPSMGPDTWAADLPAAQAVPDWATAAAMAGIPLFAPSGFDRGAPQIAVRGVPGDPTRPVDAVWPDGLRIIQADRTVMEPPEPSETFPMAGVDEAWTAAVHEVETLYARRGRSLAILTGAPLEQLRKVADGMRRVKRGTPLPASPEAVHPDAPPTAYANPVIRTDFADPAVIHASDGWFYAYATEQLTVVRMANIQVARSRDLVHWELLPDALPGKPAWAATTRDIWAPGIIEADRAFFLYFAAPADDGRGFCLGAATSADPKGPFIPSPEPLACDQGFVDIDPMPFDDPDTGKRLLYWGSDGSPIMAQELAADRLAFAKGSSPTAVLQIDSSQPYQRLIEAPWVVLRNGTYYLFTSGDDCCSEVPTYAVMVARAGNALGPYQWRSEVTGTWGDSVVLHYSDAWDAPGHNSVVGGGNGQDWLVYHAIDPLNPDQPSVAARKRPMLIDRLDWIDGWPKVNGDIPSSGPVGASSIP
jgi:arabinan endo-1,5-alpha-L-arabinosidase